MSSCIKNDGTITGDAKVRIFNTVIADTAKNFYFNNSLYAGTTGQSALSTGANTSYFVVVADQEYTIQPRNSINGKTDSSITQKFGLGLNYSIFYTKTDTLPKTKPKLLVYEDLVKPNKETAQVMFINLGYTLGSKVVIKDKLSTYTHTIGYGEKTNYITIKEVDSAKSNIFFNLVDSVGVIDSIKHTSLSKGKVYMVIIDGTKRGKLRERLVSNNN